jgi:flavin reductase (DIM6/NTAB) family NADH-FMN oxidoreductase RutF
MKKLPLQEAFTLLEPGPVILLTTADNGKNNIMTISWHMVIDFSPRFAVATGSWNYSYNTLLKTKECVIAVPPVDLSEMTVQIGCCTGAEVDKFNQFKLTPVKAENVGAPLIEECLGNIECRVVQHIEDHGIFILEGIQAWIDTDRKERRTFHANGDGTFVVDGDTISYRDLMSAKLPPGV